jgi:hypothetical protein
VVIHSPFATWGYNHRGLYPSDTERMVSPARETLGPVLARTEGMSVTFVVENIEDVEPVSRAMLRAALDWQARELSVDTGYAHRAHVSTGTPPVDFFLRAEGPRLGNIHLQDADGFADRP